jgi:hypothetical protein
MSRRGRAASLAGRDRGDLAAARRLLSRPAMNHSKPMSRRAAIAVPFAFALALAPACGSDDPGASAEAIVGHWELVDDESGELEAEYTFGDDGTFTFVEHGAGAERADGTYQAGDSLLSLDGIDDEGNRVEMEYTYFANDAELVAGALLPVGDVDGPVGTWEGRIQIAVDGQTEVSSEDRYELHDDGSAEVRSETSDGSEEADGTWRDEDGEIIVSFELESFTINVHMQLVDGLALGNPIFQRAAD